MKETQSLPQKLWQFLFIFLPIFATQVSLCAINFVDTTMSGQASPIDLAGVAIGTNLWLPVYTAIIGILMAVTPIAAQLHGAGRTKEISFMIVQGCYLAFTMAIVTMGLGYVLLPPLLDAMTLEPEVRMIAQQFLAALAWGIGPLFINIVLRNFMDSLGYTRVTMLIVVCALPLNVILNYLLIFGQLGFPRLGGVGAGYASAITHWFILLVCVAVIALRQPFKSFRLFSESFQVRFTIWRQLLQIGLPIGLAIFCETSIFGVVVLLMAQFGTSTIAAHQAAINFASLIYMLPLSIGMALTILVGFEVGGNRYYDAKQYSYLGLGIAISLALVCGAVLFYFNEAVARLYTQSEEVLHLIQQFLVYAIFFQLSDAIAAPIQGALRGYKDVKVASVMALFSYWIIGLPVGYILASYTSFGPFGYWLGFIAGLAAGAIVLSCRLFVVQSRRFVKKIV